MILRRLIEHVKAQNWFAVVLDFVIVVLGVFIGLQVQEWSRELDDRRRETRIVEGLIADLAIDRPQYATGLATDEQRVSAANAALSGAGLPPLQFESEAQRTSLVDYAFSAERIASLPAARPDRLWTDLVIGYHPVLSTLTYDAITGAGDVRIIRDGDLVREIQLYYSLVPGVEEQNAKVLSIRENLMRLGAEYGLAPFADLPTEDYLRLVATEPRLAASIRIMATFVIYHHGEIKAVEERAASLHERLENYLEEIK